MRREGEIRKAAAFRSRTFEFAFHGWVGLSLVFVFWYLNWGLQGLRTHWGFFPLWLGYCLAVDALVLARTGTSLISRSWKKYVGLFVISAPLWWMFEILNFRLQNWHYQGSEAFPPWQYWFWATLSFSTVAPAVLGTAELVSSFRIFQRPFRGPVIPKDDRTVNLFFASGILMFVSMLVWPRVFFPFLWLSLYFILEPLNIWFGNTNLARWTRSGNWQPVVVLWMGVLICAFFWEMWNYFSYPRWIYTIPWGDFIRIFEMPILGYGGYLPFALELYAMVQLVYGLFNLSNKSFIRISTDDRRGEIQAEN